MMRAWVVFRKLSHKLVWPGMLVMSLFAGCTDPDKVFEEKFEEANQKITAGEVSSGLALLETLRGERPDDPRVLEALGFAFAEAGRHAEAAEAFTAAAGADPRRPDLPLFAARSHEEAGNLEAAADQYRQYVVGRFDDVTGWQALGRVERARGHHRAATDAFLQVHRLRPSADTAVTLGELFLQLGNLAQAGQWFRQARELDPPGPAEAWLGLLIIDLEEDDRESALARMDEIEERFPGRLDEPPYAQARDEFREWRAAGEERARLAAERAAEAERREAERLAMEEEEALRLETERLAEEEARRAREEALALLEREMEEATREPTVEERVAAKLQRARQFQRARAWDDALREYWEAISLDADRASLWYELSRVLLQAGRSSEAESTALEAIRRNPSREDYHLHYLNAARETQPMRVYLSELERVLAMFPSSYEITLELARAYNHGAFSQSNALRYYRRFLQIAPPTDPRREEVTRQVRRLEAAL